MGNVKKQPIVETRFIFGAPPRPKALSRATYNAWNRLCAELLGARKLAQSDGDLVLELIQARADQYKGSGQRRKAGRKRAAELQAKFDSRPPFPEVETTRPEPEAPAPVASLEAFLADVRYERATFANRLVPGATVCRDTGAPTEEDPATVARLYCQQVINGDIVACDLLKRAAQRHLSDLETGHTKGLFFDPMAARNIATWYRDFCGLKLEPWETWIVVSLLAWKQSSGYRRFSDAWVSMGKKNGKTTLASGIGLFGLICDQEKYAEVYSAATKKDQARLIFRDAVRAVHNHPELKAYIKEFTGANIASLLVPETDCRFEPLSSETKSMDGLRPHFILADEIHMWDSREQWDKICKGTVSRPQPLTFAITTAGESENCFAAVKNSLVTKILTGVWDSPETFVAVYQLDPEDNFRDEKCWPKANPNLSVSLQPGALRKILAEAEQDPSGQTAFQRYHCNRWVSFRQGRSIPAAKWDACWTGSHSDPLELRKQFLEQHNDQNCWGGFDYGEISDLAAYVTLFSNAGVVTAIPYFWMPEFGLLDKERLWGVPLSTWAREGWIKLIDGDMTDPRIVRDDILKICADGPGHVRSIGYDPWKARVMFSEIAETKLVECMAVPQKPSELTVPCRELKQAIWEKRLQHLGNPVLRWMAGNLVLDPDESTGGIRPKKMSANEKIDGFQAMITAWHRFLDAPKTLSYDGNIKFI